MNWPNFLITAVRYKYPTVSVQSLFSGVRRIFQWGGGGSGTSHRDDVKILHYNYSSLEVLKCIVLQCFQPVTDECLLYYSNFFAFYLATLFTAFSVAY